MQYGHFDDRKCEYVIERPDTPKPWINYLGDGEYCAIISNNAGGYSFWKSPGQDRVLRYRFNSVPYDRPGRYIYLRDETGDYWSNSWAPVHKPLDKQKVVCRHGLGYTKIESRYKGIASSCLYFVPLEGAREIWKFSLTNHSNRPRTIDVFGFCEFGFPYFTAESALQAILFVAQTRNVGGVCGYTTPVPGWQYRDVYFAATGKIEGFDCDREAFIGNWHDERNPIAVENGKCSNSFGSGGNACGGLQLKFTLQPGETMGTTFILGMGKAEEAGAAARADYTDDRVEQEFQALREHWQKRLKTIQCRTPDPSMNSMINVWNAYQAHVTFRWSRSASFIEAGLRDGLGYRDTLQDTLSVDQTVAGEVKQTIVNLLRGQHSTGCALHKVQPLTLKTGQGEMPQDIYSDDHLWIPLALGGYVRETGDVGFLSEPVEYLDAGSGTVLEHARKALDYAMANRGVNGLVLTLQADWNDALQLGRHGESIWTSMQFCKACEEFAQLAQAAGKDEEAALARGWAGQIAFLINDRAWDGAWYVRALMDDGRVIGSSQSEVAKVWLNTQTWSILAGVAAEGRGEKAMDAVHKHLATEFGIHLFAPPHTDLTKDVPGRVCYPPGLKENAAIFCHPNPWAMMAETILRRGDRAYEYYKALQPSTMNDRAELRTIEPYVYGQFVTGKWDKNFGIAHNPWLTGTATWSYVAATQYILGVRPTLAGLQIDPCIPVAWSGFEFTRIFRGATYQITVANPSGLCAGVKRLKVNGKEIEGNILPIFPAGKTVKVVVVLEV